MSGIRTTGATLAGAGETRVIVETGRPGAVRTAVLAAGGRVERTWRNLVQVTVPPAALGALSNVDGVNAGVAGACTERTEGAKMTTPARAELGRCLAELRRAANRRPIDVVEAGLLSVDELLRYERGSARADPSTVYALCQFYGTGEETTGHLVSQALRMTTVGIWADGSR